MSGFFQKLNRKLRDGSIREIMGELRWLLNYAKQYRGTVIMQLCFSVAGVLLGLAGSIASKHLINSVIAKTLSSALFAGGVMAVFSLGSIGLRMLSGRIAAKASIKIRTALEAAVFHKIMHAKWESLQPFRSGDLLSRLHGDARNVSGSITTLFPGIIASLVQFIGALLIVLYYDASMALIALIGVPVSVLLSRTLIVKLRTYQETIRKKDSEIISFQEEAFAGADLIKALGITGRFDKKLLELQEGYRGLFLSHNRLSISVSALMSFLGFFVSIGCFSYGAYRLWCGAIDFGTMTLFLQLATTLSGAFSTLTTYVPQVIGVSTAAGRVTALLKLPDEEESGELLDVSEGIGIGISNVSFSYKEGRPVLRNIDFSASPGMTIGLVGTSGEGKTTFLRLLLGLLDYTGHAWFSDRSGSSMQISAGTRKYCSYVPQDHTMFAGTVADNMRMVKEDATDAEIIAALTAACAYDEFIKDLPKGIFSEIGENGKGLSQGQMQRLSIARALLKDAPIMLLDEATSALDMETEERVVSNIVRMNTDRLCIVSTHRPSALSLCDAVYRIDDTSLTRI